MVLVLLAGCGGGQSREPALDTLPPDQIYQLGEYELETRRKPDGAIKYFSEVERL
jgi:outer membrane protein assembly factor BamD